MKSKEITLTIDSYSKRGHGLGLVEKTQVEVPKTVIGDTLKVILGGRKKGKRAGTLLEILKSSEDRTEPRCVHAQECGGCTSQQITYRAQLRNKENHVKALFAPYPEATFHPIIPSDTPWHYRNKMEFSFSQNKEGEKFLGLMIARSRGRVLNLTECHLTNPWFADVLKIVRTWWEATTLSAYHPPSDKGTLRTLTIREGKQTGEKMIILTISGNPDYFINNAQLATFKKALESYHASLYLRIHRIAKGVPTDFYEMSLSGPQTITENYHINNRSYTFHISPSSFFQPNTHQAEKLIEKALAFASPTPEMLVYDLYCGTATLGIIFAPYVKKVIGVELNPYAVCDAEQNIETNQTKSVSEL